MEQPQRSEQQEWTPDHVRILGQFGDANVAEKHNTELAAERQRRDQAERDLQRSLGINLKQHDKLVFAQAVIEKAKALADIWYSQRDNQDMNDPRPGDEALEALHQFLVFIREFPDLSDLHKYRAEVREPLVKLLEASKGLAAFGQAQDWNEWEAARDDALGGMKEGK